MDIDLVYLWVDGSDPNWVAKYNAFIGKAEEPSEINCKGRTADNDELKYSLRSVEKHAPWIRHIYIVTNEQTPAWLDTSNPRIKLIDHKDILPPESLPCFNPRVVEYALYKIPGLAEHFLYANDDMFINKPVTPDDFFSADGFPIIRLHRKPFRKLRWFWREQIRRKKLLNHSRAVANSTQLVKDKYGIYYNGLPNHNIDAYLKSDWKDLIESTFSNEFAAVMKNHERSSNDLERVLYAYVSLIRKRGHLRYCSKQDSFHAQIHKESHYKKLEKYNPLLLCMNDSQYAKDDDRIRAKLFLENHFPVRSAFEKTVY
ncbi:Stealth CR1 domain-containing protein [Bacteroidales bacterium OttesenSCG-928-L03]|nr:Stealth CR1 domain-containing protein [Bacteroidales bacterium OttesenSCG-928-L03]